MGNSYYILLNIVPLFLSSVPYLLGRKLLVQYKCKYFPDELVSHQANIMATIISNGVLEFWNFAFASLRVGGDFWRWLCRQLRRNISAHVDGGASGRSSVRKPGSEDPHWRDWKFCKLIFVSSLKPCISSPYGKCWYLQDKNSQNVKYFRKSIFTLKSQSHNYVFYLDFCSINTLYKHINLYFIMI